MKKAPRLSYAGASNRKVPLSEPMQQTRVSHAAKATPSIRPTKKRESINQNGRKDDKPAAPSSGKLFYVFSSMQILSRASSLNSDNEHFHENTGRLRM